MSANFKANDNTPELDGVSPNNELRIEVARKDLPIHCPMPGTTLWNSHPRVYVPLEEGHGKASCPYCGTEYILKD